MFAIRSGAPVFLAFSIRERGWSHRYTLTLERLHYDVTGDLEADLAHVLDLLSRRVMPIESGPAPVIQGKEPVLPAWFYRGVRSSRYSYIAWQKIWRLAGADPRRVDYAVGF